MSEPIGVNTATVATPVTPVFSRELPLLVELLLNGCDSFGQDREILAQPGYLSRAVWLGWSGRAHIGTHPVAGDHDVLITKYADSTLRGTDRHAEPLGQLFIAGQLGARLVLTILDEGFELSGHLAVRRARVVRIEFVHVRQLTGADTRQLSPARLTELNSVASVPGVAVVAPESGTTAGQTKKPHRCANTSGATSYIDLWEIAMRVDGSARMLRVKAVADMFGVSAATIYRAVKNGQLDALKIGNAIRIPVEALDAFREECAEAAYQAFVIGDEPLTDDTDAVVAGSDSVAGVA